MTKSAVQDDTESNTIFQPIRAATSALIVLAVLAIGAVVTLLGPVLKPFLLAVFLYYAALFGVNSLVRIGIGRRAAYVILLLGLALASVLVGQLVAREASTFQKRWPDYERRIARLIERVPPIGEMIPWIKEEQSDAPHTPDAFKQSEADSTSQDDPFSEEAMAEQAQVDESPPKPANDVFTELFRSVSKETFDYVFLHSFDFVEVFTLVLVYLVFLFMGSSRMPGKITRGFPGERSERLLRIGKGITDSMERFMAVKTIVGIGMGASAGLIMALSGLDYWLLWAFLFFAANYITYIGSLAACIPPILLGFVALPSIGAALLMGTVLVVNRFIWIDFVEIRMSGQQLNLDPTLMFLWLAYWGWVWGVLGLLLAYPMLAAVKIVLTHVDGGEGWAVLLSDE
ncbi:MAG: AI-2E family transporter [Pirellulales bacterium]